MASYTLKFEGEFDLFDTITEELVRYSGKGKVVVNTVSIK
mgnify:FL=1